MLKMLLKSKLSAIAVTAIAAMFLVEVSTTRVAISHCNDINGQIEKFKKDTNYLNKAPETCSNMTDPDCVGGLYNVVHWLHDDTNFFGIDSRNILRMSSGNMVGGESQWIAAMDAGWEKYGEFMKKYIKASAVTFGISEFEAGIPAALNYMNATGNTTFTIANTCNGNGYSGVEKVFCSAIKPVLQIDIFTSNNSTSFPIGVIGFIDPIVERLAIPGKLKFANVLEKVQAAVNSRSDIKTFIAIGDGNLEIAKQIIDAVPKVKLVLYGTRYSNGSEIFGQYPLPYNSGFIATAGRHGSSVGKMVLDINESTGSVTVIGDKSALVTTSTTNGTTSNITLGAWYGGVVLADSRKLGGTNVHLKGGEHCWKQECTVGNLLTDAVVNCYLRNISQKLESPLLSVWHGGAFFPHDVSSKSKVTKLDVLKWLPYHDNLHLVQINGSDLRTVFALSAKGIDSSGPNEENWRQFLQVSRGFKVYYDYDTETNPGVWTVSKIKVAHDVEGVRKFKDLENETKYYLVIPTYLYEGRGIYSFNREIWSDVLNIGINSVGFDDDCLINYISALGVASSGLQRRVTINGDAEDPPRPNCGGKTWVTVILTIGIFSIVLAVIYIGYFYVLPRLLHKRQPIQSEHL